VSLTSEATIASSFPDVVFRPISGADATLQFSAIWLPGRRLEPNATQTKEGKPGADTSIVVQQPTPSLHVEQAPPRVTVQQQQPQVTVRQPQPDITVRQAAPITWAARSGIVVPSSLETS
jgi:hypothetical protein